MKKRLLSILMAATMVATCFAGCGGNKNTSAGGNSTKGPAYSDGGKVFNIYCWNTEFQDRVKAFYPGYVDNGDGTGMIGDVQVNWIITPSKDNAYQNALDNALLAQDKAAADDKVDLFLIEADYALKYVNSDYTLDVNSIGLTADDMAGQYKYTQEIVTDSNGVIKGTTWQATPGLFVYRRSIAQEVLGTDDPDAVQEMLADWDKFDAVAAKMYDAGYKMLSGYDDSYRTFSNNVSGPWVQDGKIVVDPNIERWVEQTKLYTDSGYNNKTTLWSPEWGADQGSKGKVFGFFYSTWGINFTLLGNSLDTPIPDGVDKLNTPEEYVKATEGNGGFGDWAVCYGPESYYWGGTWICGASGTDNVSLIKDIMYTLTCDAEVMKKITEVTEDFTNNEAAMTELAKGYSSAFLGGQNHIALFVEAAKKIDMSNASGYDQGLNEGFQAAMKDYFDGNISYEEALEAFFKAAVVKYPDLKY